MNHLRFSKPTLLKAIVYSTILYAALTLVVFFGYRMHTLFQENRAQEALQQGIAMEKEQLITQGDAFAKNVELKKGIRNQDSYEVLTILNSLNTTNIGGVAVADKNGTIFSRTRTSLGRGDNAFVVGPLGRELVQRGEPVFAIERSGLDPSQLIISSARYIFDGTENLGAMFTTDFMDDAYAVRFKEKYLPSGVEVLFYVHKNGIYGQSITDPEVREIVKKYFYPDSDWIAQGKGKTNTVVRFPNGKSYAVINTVFPGLTYSPGGALLFVPVYDFLPIARLLLVLLPLALGIWILICHRCMRRKTDVKYHHHHSLLVLIVLGTGLFLLSRLLIPIAEPLLETETILYNSVLKLDPQTRVFDQSYVQSVAIKIDTGPEAINTIGVVLAYDPAFLKIKDISETLSVCEQVIESSIDTEKGEIRFSCIIANPGFSGPGTVATLSFTALKPGDFSLRFLPETQVLANDGLGTDVLRIAMDGGYTATSLSDAGSVSAFSPTHPNQGQWYSNPTADFTWGGSTDAQYAYAFDSAATTTPSGEQVVSGQKISVTAPSDGIFYFHLAPLEGDLPARHYKVQIDTTPPANILIRSSSVTVKSGEVARLELEATDTGSGLQKNFYLAINSSLFLPSEPSVYVPFTTPGRNTLKVRAYDNAGNVSEQQMDIQVTGSLFQNLLSPFFSGR